MSRGGAVSPPQAISAESPRAPLIDCSIRACLYLMNECSQIFAHELHVTSKTKGPERQASIKVPPGVVPGACKGVSSSRAIRSVEILRPLVLPLLSVIVRYRPLRPLRVSFAPTGWLQSSPFIPPSPRDPARPRAIPSHPEPSRAMPMAPVHFL